MRVFESKEKDTECLHLHHFPLYEVLIAKEEDIVPIYDIEGYYIKDRYEDTYQVLIDEPVWYDSFPYEELYEDDKGTIADVEPEGYAYKYKSSNGINYEYINLDNYDEITNELDSYDNWEMVYDKNHSKCRDILYETTRNDEVVYIFYRKSFWIGDYPYGYIIPSDILRSDSNSEDILEDIENIFKYLFGEYC